MVAKGRGRGGGLCGRAAPNAKLSDESVAEIRSRVGAGERLIVIAKELGVSMTIVSQAARGDRWQHVEAPVVRRDGPRRAKLTAQQVGAIRRRYDAGERKANLASEYDVTWWTIHAIVKGKSWAHR